MLLSQKKKFILTHIIFNWKIGMCVFLCVKNLFSKLNNCRRCIFVGLGNNMKSDDGVGVFVIEKLKEKFGDILPNGIRLLDVGISLENYLNKIISYEPETIVFFDAVSRKENIKEDVKLFSVADLQNYTFSTHNLSLPTLIDYLKMYLSQLDVYVFGIQVENVSIGEIFSEKVISNAEKIVEGIVEYLGAS